jgi:hypothetical protein
MKTTRGCDGKHIKLIDTSSRREFLYVGLLGGLGLTLPQMLKMQAAAAGGSSSTFGKAKSVIHVYLPGGMAHQESFDPKPFASTEYRGPYGTVDTKIPGEKFSENFKEMAKIADKISVIRSMTHGEAAHERGTVNMFTGYRPSPALTYPSMGSVVSHQLGVRNSMPPYVTVPTFPLPIPDPSASGTGYLSSAFGPFGLGSDPASNNFKVRDLTLPNGIDEERFNRRRSMLEAVDGHFMSLEESDALTAMDTFYERAYEMISSPEARDAFNLDKEDPKLKEAYGDNQAGMRMLLSRRLVEAGVRFVSMTYGGWDHHNNVHSGFTRQGPELDKALASLINDLDDRGMLDETLVLVSTEFGRTPKINSTNGRDHWPRVFSVMMAGGGISKGAFYGSSDALAAAVENDPVTPEDLAATVFHQLGINPTDQIMSPGDRPIDVVHRNHRVITEILG